MIAALMTVAAASALHLQPILTIDPKHRIVESIASDGERLFVSSILDRTILSCTPPKCRTFATTPAGLHPFGIAWDAERKRLWVAANCPENVRGIVPCERGALLGYDARGKLMTRIASAGGPFHPGDLSVSPAGVFVTDSADGAVFRLGGSGNRLDPVLPSGVGKSGQGSVASADGKVLVVADYSQGIAAIDLDSGARTLLPRSDGKPLRGIDGVVRCGETFYGLYNGSVPGTLVSFTRSADTIAVEQPLGDVTLPDPTHLMVDGDRLLLIADSGWATLDKPEVTKTQGTVVYAVDIPGGCGAR